MPESIDEGQQEIAMVYITLSVRFITTLKWQGT
jgi:hypothetical protein